MKVRLLENRLIGDRMASYDEVVDVPESDAKYLIGSKLAVDVSVDHPTLGKLESLSKDLPDENDSAKVENAHRRAHASAALEKAKADREIEKTRGEAELARAEADSEADLMAATITEPEYVRAQRKEVQTRAEDTKKSMAEAAKKPSDAPSGPAKQPSPRP